MKNGDSRMGITDASKSPVPMKSGPVLDLFRVNIRTEGSGWYQLRTIVHTDTNNQVDVVGIDDTFHKGLKAYRDGNYPEAVQLLNKAVTENETNHKAWNALGVTYSRMGRIEEAVSCY